MSPVTEPNSATSVQNKTNKKQSNLDTEDDTYHGQSKTDRPDGHAGFKHKRNVNDHINTEPLATTTGVTASSSRSNSSEVELDCSSYEILAQSDHHNEHHRSPTHGVATTQSNGKGNRPVNSILLSRSGSGKGLNDSGTEADDEGRVGLIVGRKDGHRRIITKYKKMSTGGDFQSGSATTDNEFLRIGLEAGILVGVYVLAYRSSAVWEERHWRQKGKEFKL